MGRPSQGDTGARQWQQTPPTTGLGWGVTNLTPRQIVEALDRYIIGQEDAKRAVAVAIRNRKAIPGPGNGSRRRRRRV